MTERWQRELAKLRQTPELPDDLWDRVSKGPKMQESGISRRKRAVTIAVAVAVAISGLAVAWIAVRPNEAHVAAGGEFGVVDVPPLGQVAPANLADGRPVFVVHRTDGTLEVIDGFSTHDPWGLGKLVAWCNTSRTFEDVFTAPQWSEDGTYIAGPAPTGLATYRSTIQSDGRLLVGPLIPPAPRPAAGDRVRPYGPYCTTSDNLAYPTIPANVSHSPADVVASAPDGWVSVRGALVGGGPTGAELCSLATRKTLECADGAPVRGIDVQGLFGQDPSVVISGLFIARVEDGSLVDLTRVPGRVFR